MNYFHILNRDIKYLLAVVTVNSNKVIPKLNSNSSKKVAY